MGVSRSEKRRHEVSRLAVEDDERMVHTLALITVVVAVFLLSVGGIVGRVEV